MALAQPKIFLRAHLPNKQRTSVQVVPNLKLKDALAKALQRRDLTSEMCEVTTQINSNIPIPWDTDISLIHAEEVFVRVIQDKFSMNRKHLSHQFLRKTFLSLAFCECCRRLLFSGVYCHQCNIRFHPRCKDKVGSFCKPIDIDSINTHNNSKAGFLNSGGLGFNLPHHSTGMHIPSLSNRPPRTLNKQDRSNSAPNINSIKPLTAEQQQILIQSQVHGLQPEILFQTQNSQEHSRSTQASPTLKHPKRPRARSADESNKNLLSPRDPKSTDENWVSQLIQFSIVEYKKKFNFSEHSSRRNSNWTTYWIRVFWNSLQGILAWTCCS